MGIGNGGERECESGKNESLLRQWNGRERERERREDGRFCCGRKEYGCVAGCVKYWDLMGIFQFCDVLIFFVTSLSILSALSIGHLPFLGCFLLLDMPIGK